MTKITLFQGWASCGLVLVLAACAGSGPRPGPVASAPGGIASAPAAPAPARPAAAPAAVEPDSRSLPELLNRIEAAYRSGDYEMGLALVKRVLEMEQTDVTALDRVGSVYYVLGRYGEALTIWQRALLLEKDPRRRRELERSILVARSSLGLAPETGGPVSKKRGKGAVRRAKAASPEEVDEIYKKGVKHYARGEFLQATAAFLRVLELDPGNPKATKALERLRIGSNQPAPSP